MKQRRSAKSVILCGLVMTLLLGSVAVVAVGSVEMAYHDGTIEKTQLWQSWYSDGPHGPQTSSNRDNSLTIPFDTSTTGLRTVTNAWIRFEGMIRAWDWDNLWRQNTLNFNLNGSISTYTLGALAGGYGMPMSWSNGIGEDEITGLQWIQVPVNAAAVNLQGTTRLTMYLLYNTNGGTSNTSVGIGIDTNSQAARKSGRGSSTSYDTTNLRWNPASGKVAGEYLVSLVLQGEAAPPVAYYTLPTVSVFTNLSVHPADTFSGSWTVPTVTALRGESEPVQVVVETAATGLNNASWTCDDLTSGGHTLPASAIDIRVVGYTLLSDNVTWWPDPLFIQPAGGISVPANTRRAWWVTADVPADQAAGLYTGTLTLSAGGTPVLSTPFSVKVVENSFPSPLPLGVSIGCGISSAVLPLAQARHLYAHNGQTGVGLPQFRINRPTGQVTVDFTAFDQTVNQLRSAYGMRYICLGFIIGDATGDSVRNTTLHPYMTNELGQVTKIDIDPQDGSSATARFNSIFQQYASHLAAKGWLNDAFIYLWDEPNTTALAQEAALYAGYFKAAAPTLPVMVTSGPSTTLQPVDAFCTLVNHVIDSTWQWCQANGKHFWIYTAGNLQYPSLTIGKPALDSRIFGWVGYRFYAENLLFWAVDVAYTQAQLQSDGLTFTNVYSGGDGCLFYPAPTPGAAPLPSIRAENLRDGLEDVYLMKMAEDAGLGSTCRTFVQAHVPSQTSYDTDPSSYMAFRANLIQQLPTPTPTPIPTPTPTPTATPTPTVTPTPTPTPIPIPGDANGNGVVDFQDFAILQNNYGQSGKTWSQGDFNGDGRVTFEDFSILQNHYGQSGAAGGSPSAVTTSNGQCAPLGVGLILVLGLAFSGTTFGRKDA